MEIDSKLLNKKINRDYRNKELLSQIEFYFSDENLINDKFLKNMINKDNEKGVELHVLLSFNKIKSLIGSDTSALDKLKKIIPYSKHLKLNSIKSKVIRIKKFELNKNLINDFDTRTIYVENIPIDTNHEILKQLFSRIGKVLNISIPKNSNKKNKGFCFVTFNTKDEALEAIKSLNNIIPKEFLDWGTNHNLKAIKIISKNEWLTKKEEFKKLKKELQNDNTDLFAECLGQNNNSIKELKKGTLVKLINIPKDKNINDVKIWVSHLVEPAFVDLKNDQCIIRFSLPTLAEIFINKLDGRKIDDNIISCIKLTGVEEDEYLKKIEELRKKRLNKN